MSYFENKRVFLVGGSEGIGRATARALARQGAHVVVGARRQGPLDETVAELEQIGSGPQRFAAISVDVTDREAVRGVVQPVLDALGGGIDVLILNVGSARPGYVHDLDDADFDQMIAINYLGHVHVVRAFLASLEEGGADVCFISSALGFMSMPGYTAYSASKYAIAGFAEGLRMELAPQKVRVSLFYPGTTDTPGLVQENDSKPAAVWAMEADSSFSKTHKPEDVANSLLRAIERGRFENFPGFDVWLVWWMYKRFPRFSRYLADLEWKKARKKVEAAEVSGSSGGAGT
ncbi:MAG TPA: SDR family NAD(P)-dependent oxidoreductase [Deltaproteobacteria bacterium]|nr:SDR family NAD(P)-dependent oxidoreductase [Deltaproteobacteria bacterium]